MPDWISMLDDPDSAAHLRVLIDETIFQIDAILRELRRRWPQTEGIQPRGKIPEWLAIAESHERQTTIDTFKTKGRNLRPFVSNAQLHQGVETRAVAKRILSSQGSNRRPKATLAVSSPCVYETGGSCCLNGRGTCTLVQDKLWMYPDHCSLPSRE
jgi:hypothetical protein